MIKQSVSWWCVYQEGADAAALVKGFADAGYEGIELVAESFWPIIREHGMEIASINGHYSIEEGLNRRENAARIIAELQGKIKLAAEWHIPNIICFAGSRGNVTDDDGIAITAETLGKVAKDAENAGVNLVLELLNSKVDHPDYHCDTTAWGVQVVEMVGSPRVKLLYDIYHAQIMEGDLIRTIQQNHPHIGHYHTAGNPGRHDLDDAQEIYYPPIFRAIAETGYDGYIGHEFIPKGDDPVAAYKQAYELFKSSVS